jgi:hypothetical protein
VLNIRVAVTLLILVEENETFSACSLLRSGSTMVMAPDLFDSRMFQLTALGVFGLLVLGVSAYLLLVGANRSDRKDDDDDDGDEES